MSEKLKALLGQYERALKKLREAVEVSKTEMARDSAIQRFEFTFDLAWKTLKCFLEERDPSLRIRFPSECYRHAFQKGLIENEPEWIATVEKRNLTSHSYNEAVAEEVYENLPGFLGLYESLLGKLKKEKDPLCES